MRDYAGLIDQISRALRPNGLAILTEFDFYVYGVDKKPLVFDVVELAPPYLARWMCMVRGAVKERGGDADASTNMYRWTSEHPSFTDAVYRPFYFLACPWLPSDHPDAAQKNRLGALMRDDILARPFHFVTHSIHLTELTIDICAGCSALAAKRWNGRSFR